MTTRRFLKRASSSVRLDTNITSRDSGVVSRQSGASLRTDRFSASLMSPCQIPDRRPTRLQYPLSRTSRLFKSALIGQRYRTLSPVQFSVSILERRSEEHTSELQSPM